MECNVRDLRKSRGLTLPELAKEIGINKGTLSRIENGVERWASENKEKIETALGAEAHQWVETEIVEVKLVAVLKVGNQLVELEMRPGEVLKVEVQPR